MLEKRIDELAEAWATAFANTWRTDLKSQPGAKERSLKSAIRFAKQELLADRSDTTTEHLARLDEKCREFFMERAEET